MIVRSLSSAVKDRIPPPLAEWECMKEQFSRINPDPSVELIAPPKPRWAEVLVTLQNRIVRDDAKRHIVPPL